jgi:hypothetical protein
MQHQSKSLFILKTQTWLRIKTQSKKFVLRCPGFQYCLDLHVNSNASEERDVSIFKGPILKIIAAKLLHLCKI